MGKKKKSLLKKAKKKEDLASSAMSMGMAFLRNVLNKEGVQTNLQFLSDSLLQEINDTPDFPEQARQEAQQISEILNVNHTVLNRIAVDGVPGSGKSTLARALANQLGMQAVCLDHQHMDQPLPLTKELVVYEHHRLLRTQDLDCFDVIIYLDQPVSVSKKNILKRKRGAYLLDIMDFDLLRRIGKKAFSLADGPSYSPKDSYARIKCKPDSGFKDRENLSQQLQEKGFSWENLNKEEEIFLLMEGIPQKGFLAYIKPRAYEQEFLSALAETFAGKD
ncbi:MAG: (d)CMP kinase [SAR324 cluster bacterium]|nr:(d)CMP kinase [SAR324 cluster bacterium]